MWFFGRKPKLCPACQAKDEVIGILRHELEQATNRLFAICDYRAFHTYAKSREAEPEVEEPQLVPTHLPVSIAALKTRVFSPDKTRDEYEAEFRMPAQ